MICEIIFKIAEFLIYRRGTHLMIFIDPPDVTITLSEKNDTTIVLESIRPSGGWNYFSIEATPVLLQSYVNKTNWTLPLEINGLIRGIQYTFNVSVNVNKNYCELGTNRQSSAVANACTGIDMRSAALSPTPTPPPVKSFYSFE